MKKSLLALFPAALLILSGCAGNNGGDTTSPSVPTIPTPTSEVTLPPLPSTSEAPKHATSMSLTPGRPFYLRLGDMSSTIKAGLDPSPTDPAEYTFTWKTSSEDILGITPSGDTKSVTLNAKKLGKARITCTNDFYKDDPKFTKSVEATIVEAGKNVYIWEYAGSSELAQFGYEKDTKPNGNASGEAQLGGLTWHYERSKPSKIRSDGGAICFGKKGTETDPTDGPEGQIVLTSTNTRKVKMIGVECSSQDGTSQLTVKVGDTTFINESTTNDVINHQSDELEHGVEGNISIKFSPSNGSIHLKSIIIFYEAVEEELFETTFDLVSGEASTWEGNSYVERELVSEKAKIHFDAAKYGDVAKVEPAMKSVMNQKGLIRISSSVANEVIDHVEAKFIQHETDSTKQNKTVKGYSSYYGPAYFNTSGAPISEVSVNKDSADKNFALRVEPITSDSAAILLDPSSNANTVYVTEIKVYTKVGTKAVFDKIEIKQGPTQTKYVDGEAFNPEGMLVEISFQGESFDPIDVTSLMSWGAIDKATGTCVGEFDGHSVTVTGLTFAEYEGKTWNKVTSELADYSGTYLLVNTPAHLIMNGACEDMTKGDNYIQEPSVFSTNVINGTKAVDDAMFVIAKVNDEYTIKAVNGSQKYIGCGSSGIGASASVGTNQKLTISWVSDHLEIGRVVNKKVDDVPTDVPYVMAVTSTKKFNFVESAKADANSLVELYKLAD